MKAFNLLLLLLILTVTCTHENDREKMKIDFPVAFTNEVMALSEETTTVVKE